MKHNELLFNVMKNDLIKSNGWGYDIIEYLTAHYDMAQYNHMQ